MSNVSDLIRKIDFFEPLDGRLVQKIGQNCIPREYAAGDHIVRQGDPGLGLYFIADGRVKVEVDRGGSKIIVAELISGDCAGELSIIDSKPRSADVICLTDTSCLLLTRDRFLKLVDKYPEIAVQMAKALAARLRNADVLFARPHIVAARHPEPAHRAPDPVLNSPAAESEIKRLKNQFTESAGLLLMLQPLLRISLAVVGCPVTVSLESAASESHLTAIGPVRFVLFPACENQTIRLHAFGDGDYNAAVFQPDSSETILTRFTGRIRRGESAFLHAPAHREPWFEADSPPPGRLKARFPRTSRGRNMRRLADVLDNLMG